MKRNSIGLVSCLFLFLLAACKVKPEFSATDTARIPYTGNEVIIFESRSGENCVLYLWGNTIRYVYEAAQSDFFNKRYQAQWIIFGSDTTLDISRYDGDPPPALNFIVFVKRSDTIWIQLEMKGKYKGYFLENLSQIKKDTSLSIEQTAYRDVIVMNNKDAGSSYLSTGKDSISRLFWSRASGLVGFQTAGDFFVLKEKKVNTTSYGQPVSE